MHTDPELLLASQVRARAGSDYRFNWPTYAGWCVLTLGFYGYYGLYRLIERRVEHGRRRLLYSAGLWHVLAARADAAGSRAAVQDGLDNLSRVHATLEEHETRNRRNPALLLVLRLAPALALSVANSIATARDIPIESDAGAAVAVVMLASIVGVAVAGFWINHMLNADLRFVEAWEDALFQNAAWVLARLGAPVPSSARPKPHPKRETALYVVLSILTAGLFAIAWRAMLMNDGNAHCDGDDRFEDAIMWALGIRPDAVVPPMPPLG